METKPTQKEKKICNWCGNKLKWWQRKMGDSYHLKCWYEAYEQDRLNEVKNGK